MTDQGAENVRKELKERDIKLWMPPYFGLQGSEQALVNLASTFSQENALQHLRDFQEKALNKLRTKGKILDELSIKILGGGEGRKGVLFEGNDAREDESQSCIKAWAERMEQTSPQNNKNNTFRLYRVNPELMLDVFIEQLATLLNAGSIRLVHKGKSLTGEQDVRLVDVVSSGTASILCLVQSKSPRSDNNSNPQQTTTTNPDEALIASIRTAASRLQSSSQFDITDASGNLVSMSDADRIAFLTALGLHAIAKQKLQQQQQDDEDDNNNLQSALVFLLQADEEWKRLDSSWRNRVDNYGLLQLDICWVYLKFESIENLPNVVERLDKAETALRKQVDRNFVTLALVQADQNNPVPAVSAIFVRLFLLQGVAQHYFSRNETKSQERLDWAWGLAKSLREVSPAPSVARLCEAGVALTPFQAVSALRRTNGNIDQAAALIEKDELDTAKASEQRYKQTKLGLCENGRDYVDLKLVDQLQMVLGLTSDYENVTSGLLRLGNNNLERALDLYQEAMRDNSSILRRVEELDESQGVSTRNKRRRKSETKTDEMALVSLVSMGVDDETAKRALANSDNNVEMALLWVTNQQDNSSTHIDDTSLNIDEASNTDSLRDDLSASGIENSARATSVASAPSSQEDGSAITSRRISFSPRQVAEEEAVALLQEALGQVLEEQNQGGCDCLGITLDEEWKYIEQYRGK